MYEYLSDLITELDNRIIEYESRVSLDKKKKYSIYYTPLLVADYITKIASVLLVDWGVKPEDLTIVEPSCGAGRFLLALYMNNYKSPIICYDIDKEALEIAKEISNKLQMNATIKCANFIENINNNNIFTSDFLDIKSENVLFIGNLPFNDIYTGKEIYHVFLEKIIEYSHINEKNVFLSLIVNRNLFYSRSKRKTLEKVYNLSDTIIFLDLNGDTRQKSLEKDENIFDITVGVGILLIVNHRNKKRNVKKIISLKGDKEQKLCLLSDLSKSVVILKEDKGQKLCLPSDLTKKVVIKHKNKDYEEKVMQKNNTIVRLISDIFYKGYTGYSTKKDDVLVKFSCSSDDYLSDDCVLYHYRVFDYRYLSTAALNPISIVEAYSVNNPSIILFDKRTIEKSKRIAVANEFLHDLHTGISTSDMSFPLFLNSEEGIIKEKKYNIRDKIVEDIMTMLKLEISYEDIFYYVFYYFYDLPLEARYSLHGQPHRFYTVVFDLDNFFEFSKRGRNIFEIQKNIKNINIDGYSYEYDLDYHNKSCIKKPCYDTKRIYYGNLALKLHKEDFKNLIIENSLGIKQYAGVNPFWSYLEYRVKNNYKISKEDVEHLIKIVICKNKTDY